MIDHEYESLLQARSEAAEAAYRSGQRRQRRWFLFLLLVLVASASTGAWVMWHLWTYEEPKAAPGPSGEQHEAPSSLKAGEAKWKNGKLERFSW